MRTSYENFPSTIDLWQKVQSRALSQLETWCYHITLNRLQLVYCFYSSTNKWQTSAISIHWSLLSWWQVRLLVGVLKSVGTGDLTVPDGKFVVSSKQWVRRTSWCMDLIIFIWFLSCSWTHFEGEDSYSCKSYGSCIWSLSWSGQIWSAWPMMSAVTFIPCRRWSKSSWNQHSTYNICLMQLA